MAKEVVATFTAPQLDSLGNIIYNGYAVTGPNTINKKAWQYKETNTAPVNLPSITNYTPALKGWTTNYMQYYTQLQPNGYGVDPGSPTMFNYWVNGFSLPQGPVAGLSVVAGGSGYAPGTYTIPLTGGTGVGATATVVVSAPPPLSGGAVTGVTIVNAGSGYPAGVIQLNCPTLTLTGSGIGLTLDVKGDEALPEGVVLVGSGLSNPGTGYFVNDTVTPVFGSGVDAVVRVTAIASAGPVSSVAIVNPGTGYSEGDSLTGTIPGGAGFISIVTAITVDPTTGGEPAWAQAPRRFFQNQVADFVPPTANQQAIPYSFLYPVSNNPASPPIGVL
jgi:hypothetical protein